MHSNESNKSKHMNFTAIAVTAANLKQASAYKRELFERRVREQLPKDCIVLAVPDPSGARCAPVPPSQAQPRSLTGRAVQDRERRRHV